MIDFLKIDCIVGNANFTKDYSDLIDSHSFVARFNTLKNLGSLRGNKTDIIFINSCTNQGLQEVIGHELSVHTSPLGREKCNCKNSLPILDIGLDRVSVGTRVLHYLDEKASSLSIFGFNWREEPKSHYSNYVGYGPHDWKKEKELCLKIIENNNWKLYE